VEPTKRSNSSCRQGIEGGADQMARIMQGIIVKHHLMKQSMW